MIESNNRGFLAICIVDEPLIKVTETGHKQSQNHLHKSQTNGISVKEKVIYNFKQKIDQNKAALPVQ